ncbi:MAG: putative RDD family membrane protein YckC [Zhongshania aliphaticivorans]|jgi:uncharacterized RDD family membrane protein YckC|uniref:RDD domain-containing protein n=1 Tax=Zhongshania aliphaticivorans TaxID=1470434 RepID=A0A127M6F7_9GAMM|nr:RDD family protein [Zhongshania aliphaticivorans]AMO68822.1 hypothetical protein AZF00_11160 [Zhongshania aliphaticivorans]EIF43546.1 RDD domain-containing protein [gamma proteobacterium BDW918]|tara:strand:- start:6023 stop:6526 length:504 start_codon:yes stop_codon:yes gene_type:complete
MTAELPPPGVFRRLAAIVYDCFLLFAVLFVATLIPALLFSPDIMANDAANDSVVHELNSPLGGGLYRAYLLSFIIVFYGWFWRKNGQTLGMQAWRIKLESIDGGRPSWGQCLIRLCVAVPALGLAGLGYWWIWLDRDSLAWHDRASKTRLRSLPKAGKNKPVAKPAE